MLKRQKILRQSFPNAEIMLRIKTTPTSVVAISVYPSQEKADEARVELDKRVADYGMPSKTLVSIRGSDICLFK